jgi:hypothetical protein
VLCTGIFVLDASVSLPEHFEDVEGTIIVYSQVKFSSGILPLLPPKGLILFYVFS